MTHSRLAEAEVRSGIAPLGSADMPPPPLSTWRIIGPGIVAAGAGLGSGEFILFPFIASNVGLAFLWAAIIGVMLQYFLNMEIERYALATGETAITGMNRLGRHWGLVMLLMALASLGWPGWAASSATLVTYLVGGDPQLIGVLMLVAAVLMLTVSPIVYRTLERTLALKVIAVGILFIGAIPFVVTGYTALQAARSAAAPVIPVEQLGWAVILGAVAFAGMGGVGNLCLSNWVRDKGFGMGAHAPRIVSPLLGVPVAAPGTGWRFTVDDESMRRWQGWWRVANIEQLSAFAATCIVTIALTSLVAFAVFAGRPDLPNDINFLLVEGQVLSELLGNWFGTLFWVIGAFSMFGTQVAILDVLARLSADVIHSGYGKGRNESRVYAITVCLLGAFGVAVIAVNLAQPLALLILSACLAGFSVVVYAPLLILLNFKLLPRQLWPTWPRVTVLVLTTLVFAGAAAATIADQFSRFG